MSTGQIVQMKSEFHEVAAELANLLYKKNAAYGRSHSKTGQVIALLYPNGISLMQSQDALTVVRIIDKLFRIAHDKHAFHEDPWADIAGYAILQVVERRAVLAHATPEAEKS